MGSELRPGLGGDLVLRAVLVAAGHAKSLKPDAFGLSGFDWSDGLTPARALDLAKDVLENRRVPDRVAEKFRDASQFFHALGPSLQREEARRAVPVQGFLAWLSELVAQYT